MSNIVAEFAQMKVDAKEIEDAASEFNNGITRLYEIVNNLGNAWEGSDNISYVNKVNTYEKDLKSLGEVVINYAKFLESVASDLNQTQDDVSNAAKRL